MSETIRLVPIEINDRPIETRSTEGKSRPPWIYLHGQAESQGTDLFVLDKGTALPPLPESGEADHYVQLWHHDTQSWLDAALFMWQSAGRVVGLVVLTSDAASMAYASHMQDKRPPYL